MRGRRMRSSLASDVTWYSDPLSEFFWANRGHQIHRRCSWLRHAELCKSTFLTMDGRTRQERSRALWMHKIAVWSMTSKYGPRPSTLARLRMLQYQDRRLNGCIWRASIPVILHLQQPAVYCKNCSTTETGSDVHLTWPFSFSTCSIHF